MTGPRGGARFGIPLRGSADRARRLDRHMTVNLTALSYIDAACAATIVQAATRLPASRRMTVACQGPAAKMLDLVGGRDTPRLRVVPGDDQR
jgi:hypothetical protein